MQKVFDKNIILPLTVLMPVYNAEKYLKEAIESILQQTFADFEFLIINDGSTDSSKEIILSYNDHRINYIENETNKKLVETLNIGLNLSRGKYIARMDADDISFPDRLKRQFEFMENNPNVGACGTMFENFGDLKGSVKYEVTHDKIRINMLFYSQICHPSVILRKETLDKFNICYNHLYIHAEDLDFFVKIAEVSEIANIPEVLIKYRQHNENISNSYKQIQRDNTKKIILSQFVKIGVIPNNDEIELFISFGDAFFDFNRNEYSKLELFLIKVINANKESKYFSVNEFSALIGKKWFHLSYNMHQKLMFFKYIKSPLSKIYKSESFAMFKMFCKMIFKSPRR